MTRNPSLRFGAIVPQGKWAAPKSHEGIIRQILETAKPVLLDKRDQMLREREQVHDICSWAEEKFYIASTSAPIVLFDHQKAILRLGFTRNARGRLPYRTIIYSAPKKSGKCLASIERVLLSDGSWRQAGDLVGQTVRIPAYDQQQGLICPGAEAHFEDNGIQPCVEVLTKLGRRLIRTSNHPLLRWTGWVAAGNLVPGQKIAVPLYLPSPAGHDELTLDEAALLGLLIADGGLTDGAPSFTKWYGPLREEFIRIVASYPGVVVREEDDGHTLIPTTGRRGGKPNSNPITAFVRAQGLDKHGAAAKFVPDTVFRSSNVVVSRFLNRLYACDGWAAGSSVGYSTNSRRLAEDVFRLLLRFGIHAKLRRRPCPDCQKTAWHWCVDISDRKAVRTFAEQIGMLGKEESLANVYAVAQSRTDKRVRQIDVFERSVWDRLTENNAIKKTWAARRDVVLARAQERGCADLVDLTNAEIGWDEVVSVTPVGSLSTVAIEVPDYETFVTDTIEHNTALAAVVARWFAETQGRYQDIIAVGNDQMQAKERSFRAVRESIELSPGYDLQHERLPGRWHVQATSMRCLLTGSKITAIAVDARGEAGGAPAISVWTELWGAEHTEAIRLWEELTPVPTVPDSMRLVETYAGYTGESKLLNDLYNQGLEGRQLTAGEVAERTGTPIDAWHEAHGDPDVLIPVWEDANASILMYWDSGLVARRMPWQQGENGEEYYRTQEILLSPNAYARLHYNEWTSSESALVSPEAWDACFDSSLPPFLPGDKSPTVLGVDAATTNDTFAVVAVSRHPTRPEDPAVRAVKVWTPQESGGKIDYDAAEDWIRQVCAAYNVVQITYDPYQLEQMMGHLRRDQVAWCEPFSQQQDRLIADKGLYDLIIRRRLAHNGDATLRQHVINAGAKLTRDETTLRLVKRQQHLKIDAAVAMSMAASRCLYLTLA